nr:pectinesterase 2-like [Ipomoea trifida]
MTNLQFLFASSFLAVFIFTAVSGYSPAEIKSWCSQTPYPQPCEYYLSRSYNNGGQIKDKSDFLKVAKNLALQYAKSAKDNTYSLGTKCRSGREKAAWEDCLELYENMVQKIDTTIDPNVKCSSTDAQTWLSTALTNLETCRAGFVDLGVTGNILPAVTSNNVSYLISNTLAVNKGFTATNNEATGYTEGFPNWVRPGDRKLLQSSAASKANIVVAQDGSGNYKTVTDAVNAAAKRSGSGRYVIYVKSGVYKENVNIGSSVKNIMLVGDGIGKTIITGSQSVGGGTTTFKSATVAVVGDGFIGQGITFRNTAGAANHQAVALRSGSDLSVFYQCSFEGYQDTLYVYSDRQFYRECDIYGTVDFIFAASDLKGSLGSVKTYLGRPWKEYSRTVFMKSSLDSLIDPAGWLPWDGTFALNTLYYGEYSNTGAGASTANRVKWGGYHVITSATEASKFTVGNFIAGGSWLPATNVPFTSGL